MTFKYLNSCFYPCHFFSYFQSFCLKHQWLPFFHIFSFCHQLCHFSLLSKCSFFSGRFTTSTRFWGVLAGWSSRSTRNMGSSRTKICLSLQLIIFYPATDLLFDYADVMINFFKPSSFLSYYSAGNKELYSLWTSNITLKISPNCCIWSLTASMLLGEYIIPSAALDFLMIFLF